MTRDNTASGHWPKLSFPLTPPLSAHTFASEWDSWRGGGAVNSWQLSGLEMGGGWGGGGGAVQSAVNLQSLYAMIESTERNKLYKIVLQPGIFYCLFKAASYL